MLYTWLLQLRTNQSQLSTTRIKFTDTGFSNELYTTAELLDKADAKLLGLYIDQNIVFIVFYPIILTVVELRDRGQSLPVPQCKYNSYKNSFISLCLFNYV